MTGDIRVVEDGLDQASRERPPQGPSWFWLVVGFVIGLGLAIVFFNASGPVEVPAEDEVSFPDVDSPEETTSETVTASVEEPVGVSESIEGFPDTLVAVTQVGAGNMGYLTWPLSGPPHTDPMPGFSTGRVEFDRSGRMLAMATPVADSSRFLLSLGTQARVRPLAADVSGFAWHDSDAGRLAYTQMVDGVWQLSRVDSSQEPEPVTSGAEVAGKVVTWGEWGYAIQDEGLIRLLWPTGELKAVIEGRALDSTPDGSIIVSGDGLKVISGDGGIRELEADLDLIGEVEAARLSPDASRVAIVGGGGHLIVPMTGEGEAIHAAVTSGFPQMAWTSDSRFVIAPWIRGVLVIDTAVEGQWYTELNRHTIVAVAAVPLATR